MKQYKFEKIAGVRPSVNYLRNPKYKFEKIAGGGLSPSPRAKNTAKNSVNVPLGDILPKNTAGLNPDTYIDTPLDYTTAMPGNTPATTGGSGVMMPSWELPSLQLNYNKSKYGLNRTYFDSDPRALGDAFFSEAKKLWEPLYRKDPNAIQQFNALKNFNKGMMAKYPNYKAFMSNPGTVYGMRNSLNQGLIASLNAQRKQQRGQVATSSFTIPEPIPAYSRPSYTLPPTTSYLANSNPGTTNIEVQDAHRRNQIAEGNAFVNRQNDHLRFGGSNSSNSSIPWYEANRAIKDYNAQGVTADQWSNMDQLQRGEYINAFNRQKYNDLIAERKKQWEASNRNLNAMDDFNKFRNQQLALWGNRWRNNGKSDADMDKYLREKYLGMLRSNGVDTSPKSGILSPSAMPNTIRPLTPKPSPALITPPKAPTSVPKSEQEKDDAYYQRKADEWKAKQTKSVTSNTKSSVKPLNTSSTIKTLSTPANSVANSPDPEKLGPWDDELAREL